MVVSTFDNFTTQLLKSGAVGSLPVVTQEVGDSWIYGDPSDARKQAQMRALHRTWEEYAASGGAEDAQFLNATRFMLKNMEHTWGEHEHGLDYRASNWSNAGFAKLRATKPLGYETLEGSWWEQRRFGINATREALEKHPLGKAVEAALEAYDAACEPDFIKTGVDPVSLGWSAVPLRAVPTTALTIGDVTVGIDATSGAVNRLDFGGEAWAGFGRELFGIEYLTPSADDFSTFQRGYSGLSNPPSWFQHDFGKPGDSLANHTVSTVLLKQMWTRGNTSEALLLLTPSWSEAAVLCGGAQRYFLHLALDRTERNSLLATLHVVEKTPTRHAEALFLRFNPPQAFHAEGGAVEIDKLGQWLPAKSGLAVDGGSKLLHGVQSGVRAHSAATGNTLTVEMMDAGVVCLGEPSAFPIALHVNGSHPWTPPNVAAHGFSSMLFNNAWGTNYIMWQPYRRDGRDVPAEANYAFRYRLRWSAIDARAGGAGR